MYDARQELRDLADRAQKLHHQERLITLESTLLVGELERHNAAVNLHMTSEQFATYIGLTPNQFWKRAQAARVIRRFPKALDMVQAGETQVSHLALISPRITEANAEILLSGVKNKSKREVESFLSRVTKDGRLLDKEAEVELRLKLTESQLALLDRAREVLSHSGKVPSLPEILTEALDALLERRDPMRKAERAARRGFKSQRSAPGKENLGNPSSEAPSLEKGGRSSAASITPSPAKEALSSMRDAPTSPSPGKGTRPSRPAIPAAVRHAVWLRDGGQCTWTYPNGGRCPERAMLELDHHTRMWCRGGRHSVDNLTLRCRRHNRFSAAEQLGWEFMDRWVHRIDSEMSYDAPRKQL